MPDWVDWQSKEHSNPSMSLFSRGPMFNFNGGYVVVDDPAVALEWYSRVFGCRANTYEDDERGTSILAQFSDEDPGMAILGPPNPDAPDEPPPILNTNNIQKAHAYLTERGAYVGAIEQDAQGTKHFEVRDCCGNILEVSEEP